MLVKVCLLSLVSRGNEIEPERIQILLWFRFQCKPVFYHLKLSFQVLLLLFV
jgi:hypothetical protein